MAGQEAGYIGPNGQFISSDQMHREGKTAIDYYNEQMGISAPSSSSPRLGDVAPMDQGAWRQPGSQPTPSNTPTPVSEDVSPATATPAPNTLAAVSSAAQNGLQAASPAAAPNTSQTKWNTPESSATNMLAIQNARQRQTLAQQTPQSAMSGLSGLRY
jgi:hypothetical protein